MPSRKGGGAAPASVPAATAPRNVLRLIGCSSGTSGHGRDVGTTILTEEGVTSTGVASPVAPRAVGSPGHIPEADGPGPAELESEAWQTGGKRRSHRLLRVITQGQPASATICHIGHPWHSGGSLFRPIDSGFGRSGGARDAIVRPSGSVGREAGTARPAASLATPSLRPRAGRLCWGQRGSGPTAGGREPTHRAGGRAGSGER